MKRYSLIAMCALIVVACMHEESLEVPSSETPRKVYASIESLDTRAQLNSERHTVWTAMDTILVMSADKWSVFCFDGKTGDRSGSFTHVSDAEDFRPGDYGVKEHYAIYPYHSSQGISSGVDGEPYLWINVAKVQNYLKDSYGLHANVMFGTSDDFGKTFSFINLYGYLRLNLTGSKAVRRIKLWENTYSVIAGRLYFSPDKPDEVFWYDNFSSELILDCGEIGVQLSEEPTGFYFALPAVTMPSGLGILVEFTDGSEFYQMTTKEIVLQRNTIQPMAVLDTDHEYDWQYVRIDHTARYFSFPWMYGSTSMSGWIFMGDDNRYCLDIYSYRYEYGDEQGSHNVTIKIHDAETVWLNDMTGVTKVDFSEF